MQRTAKGGRRGPVQCVKAWPCPVCSPQIVPGQGKPLLCPGGSSIDSAVFCCSDTSPALSASPLPRPLHLCSNTLYFHPILPYQDSQPGPLFHVRPHLVCVSQCHL